MADAPEHRRRAMVEAVVAARRDDAPVTFRGQPAGASGSSRASAAVVYADRTLRLELDDDGRERLDGLLAEYRVVKVEQPATRRADPGVVYLSAVTDPKHAADFLEALFRQVYCAPEDYELAVER